MFTRYQYSLLLHDTGLPVCVTLTLTNIAKRMEKASVLVKNLVTVETLGSMQLLASDKTGTLTQNRMSVDSLMVDQLVSAASIPNRTHVQPLVVASVLCNRAHAEFLDGDRCIGGNATDIALFNFAELLEIDVEDVRRALPQCAELPFSSSTKRMLTAHRVPGGTLPVFAKAFSGLPLPPLPLAQCMLVILKGAAERIIPKCRCMLHLDGHVRPLPEQSDLRRELELQQQLFGEHGKRVIGISCQLLPCPTEDRLKHLCEDDVSSTNSDLYLGNLCLLGLVAIEDPPRDDVPDSVATCRRAGIRVAMGLSFDLHR